MTPELYEYSKKIKTFFGKHHAILYVIFAGIFMSIIVYILYQIFVTASTPAETKPLTIGNFDKKTINEVKKLQDSKNATYNYTLPSPRPSPFVE